MSEQPPSIGRVLLAGLVALGMIVILFLAVRASAHDHNHPELNVWFMGLHSGKGACCDGSDAMSIDDPDWQNDSGHYRVRLEGERVGRCAR